MFIEGLIRKHTEHETIYQFEKDSLLPPSTIYSYNDIEKAKKMSLRNAVILAYELGITVDQLVREIGL